MRLVIELSKEELETLSDAVGGIDTEDEEDAAWGIHTLLKEVV